MCNQGKILCWGCVFFLFFPPGPISGPICFPILRRRPETYFLASCLDCNPTDCLHFGGNLQVDLPSNSLEGEGHAKHSCGKIQNKRATSTQSIRNAEWNQWAQPKTKTARSATSGCIYQKKPQPRVRQFSARNSDPPNECANFMGAWIFGSACCKTSMPIKFAFLAGVCFWWEGGCGMGVSETGSAIDVRIDDAGSILNFRIGFSLWFSAVVSQLRPSCPIGFGGIGGRYWISVSGSYRQ